MPILQPDPFLRAGFFALALVAVPAAAQTGNPLAGQTQAPAAASVGVVAVPTASRGKLEPDTASGGVVFSDEQGWYRFTMADGGTIGLEGEMRVFTFQSGGQECHCFAIRQPHTAYATFPNDQIQAALDTAYSIYEPNIEKLGLTIEKRQTITLDAVGQRSAVPLRMLGWDARNNANGQRTVWAVMPSPAGQLLFSCMGADAGHGREIIQRYLRIGEGMMVPGK